MTALQIVKGRAGNAAPSISETSEAALPKTVDLVVDGVNLTARVPHAEPLPWLRDLSWATADLAALRSTRRSVRCYSGEGPWELGLERADDRLLVSLYRGGPFPEVAIFEREVDFAAFTQALIATVDLHASGEPTHALELELSRARAELSACAPITMPAPRPPILAHVEPESETGIRVCCDITLRERSPEGARETTVERADLFSLLARGTLRIGVGERTRSFSDIFVFLFAEQLVELAQQTLDAWEKGRTFYRRVEMCGVVLGVRLIATAGGAADPERQPGLWLSVGGPRPGTGDARTFRLADGAALADATLGFGRALARALLRHDPAQRLNLRLTAFRSALRALDERLSEAKCDDVKVNPAPEIYRTFVPAARGANSEPRNAAKLRFSPGWTASFPGIDLRATFLCGDHLVVGAARETACVERRTGEFLWRRPTQAAVSVVTPVGLARLFADGSIALHDYASGEVMLTTRLSPRVGGVMTGAVVSAPGLPRLLIVSEGKRHLSAVELDSGEVRWRHVAQGGSIFRLRRAGKLLIVVAGDATLTALDVASGEVVWRARDRLRFSTHVGLDHDALFATAGEPDGSGRGIIRLHHLDPYAGTTRWVREMKDGPSPVGAPLVTDHEVVVVTRDRPGLGLLALDRATGATLWSAEPGLFPIASAWLAIDDSIVVSSESGDLACWATRDGATRWRHRFPRGMEGDQPRKLEPILRSGALFVPQQQVHVVRPRDGAILGNVPTELIPDLLRVDERCDVYVAEESGHLASFRAGAKLSLV
jgi:outer membrane protein assembly factor BamB